MPERRKKEKPHRFYSLTTDNVFRWYGLHSITLKCRERNINMNRMRLPYVFRTAEPAAVYRNLLFTLLHGRIVPLSFNQFCSRGDVRAFSQWTEKAPEDDASGADEYYSISDNT
jgi:hypothetical protein